jgi:hypothetical protein|tara:strand:+ start:8002 stop:8157 length:156 start_codon:yes stop_codon:yes gene_type:complete
MEYVEVKQKLLLLDEITLMELLQVTSEDLIDKFEDKLLANYPYIYNEVEEV